MKKTYNQLIALACIGSYLQASPDGSIPVTSSPTAPAETPKTKEQIAAEAAAAAAAKQEKFNTIIESFKAKGALVDLKESSFFFKKIKLEDDKGEPTGEEYKRPTVELPIPVPSLEGLVEILKDSESKAYALVFEALFNIVADRARDLLNENQNYTAENFPIEELVFSKIADLPKAERRGGGIAEEVWKDFHDEYVAIMAAAAGKPQDAVNRAAKLFLGKLNACKYNKPVLGKLRTQLAIFLEHTKRAEDFAKCVEFLDTKIDTLLKADDSKLADLI